MMVPTGMRRVTSSAAAPATPTEPDQYGSMPVGLEGYCPVMLAERGVWVEGRAQWGVRHRGRTYLFAGADVFHIIQNNRDIADYYERRTGMSLLSTWTRWPRIASSFPSSVATMPLPPTDA